jgi:hypothetical protein
MIIWMELIASNFEGCGVLYSDEGGSRLIRNVGIYVHNYTAMHPRTHNHEEMWL